MKKNRNFLLIALILLVIIFSSFAVFINSKGKEIVKGALEENFKTPVTIGSLSFQLPLAVEIKDFSCGDLAFKRARINLGILFNPFNAYIPLDRIDIEGLAAAVAVNKEEITLKPFLKQPFKSVNSAYLPSNIFDVIPDAFALSKDKKVVPFKIGILNILSSTIIVKEGITGLGEEFIFNNVRATIKNLTQPQLAKFDLNIKASMQSKNRTMPDMLEARGWVDYSNKNMDVKVTINDFDYFVLVDYYNESWKPEVIGLKKALLSADAAITSQDNDMIIKVLLSVNDYEFADIAQDQSKRDYVRTILSLSKKENGKIVLPLFEVRTKMDSPSIDYAQIKEQFKNIAKQSITNVVGNVVSDVISGKTDSLGEIIYLFKKKKHSEEESTQPVAQEQAVQPISNSSAE